MTKSDAEINVSIVITCFNHSKYLPDAIESAMAQTTSGLEILIVDDGSTDDTGQVAQRYSAARYLRRSHQGLSAARNAGIEEAHGEFIVFLDADDRFLPGAVAAGLECFRQNPECAFVFGRFQRFRNDDNSVDTPPVVPCPEDPFIGLLEGNLIGMHGTVMYRRSVLREFGGFDQNLRACEDYDVYLKMAKDHRVACHDEVVAEYRKHDTNMSNDTELMIRSVLSVLRRYHGFARKDKRRLQAYEAGCRAWKQFYGRELKEQLKYLLRNRRWRLAARRLVILIRYTPGSLLGDDNDTLRGAGAGIVRRLHTKTRDSIRLLRRKAERAPVFGSVELGDLRRVTPFSREFGFDRGQPIDRYFIENFLESSVADVKGHLLEIGDDSYTRAYSRNQVSDSDVLHIDPDHSAATIVADLAQGDHIPSDRFDCIIFTQTLQLVFEIDAAVATLYRILKPGGVLLATVPGTISQLEQARWRSDWCWGFTPLSIERTMGGHFPSENLEIRSYGNVLASTAFLYGLAAEELKSWELDYRDDLYPLVITVRAQKPLGEMESRSSFR